jgi:hypothetical protein
MNWFSRLSHANAVEDDELAEATADSAAEDSLVELAADLLAEVKAVTPAEFTWQEAHYEHDSRRGRELLFLMANYEWVRATSEIVDIARSDTIETTIKIDVDLSQVTHEAFRNRTGPIWLPVAILPPYIRRDDPSAPPDSDQDPREPDLFATVTDAAGKPVPMMPAADLQHQISAAMAEIIAKMAVSYMPADSRRELPIATRDQRLLLSAAIYRVLRQGADEESLEADWVSAIDAPRLTEARDRLVEIVGYFSRRLKSLAGGQGSRTPSATDDALPAELARRAVKVLLALRESLIVVVLMDYVVAPSVLSVRVPPRRLNVSSSSLFKPRTWIIRPAGRLEIAVLMATADADRQIQVNLPDGVSIDRRRGSGADNPDGPWLDMAVHTPLPLQDLSAALDQVAAAQQHVQDGRWPAGLVRPFMDLVRVSAAEAVNILRHYQVGYRRGDSANAPADPPTREALLTALRHVAMDPDWRGEPFLAFLATARRAFTTGKPSLTRHVKLSVVSARTITGRVNIIEDVPQRAIPKRATISADVTVEDRDYFATARSSAFMSLVLMLVVLGFLLGWNAVNPKAMGPVPEVLAIVLTLFATTQADRIERPDRSTLRGRLYTIGNWLIAASVLPALTLAIALGFEARGATADYWAVGCVVAQVCLLVPMQNWPLVPTEWHGLGKRRILSTETPDYRHFEALRSDYWRDTTAEALMIGRKAYGYIVWQKADPDSREEAVSPKLLPLLVWRGALPTESSSVLALLRTGTLRQAVTFIVFRGKPDDRWWPAERNGGNGHAAGDRLESQPLDLAPGRLTPATGVSRMVDLFVGVSRDEILTITAHPVSIAVQAAANKLTVLDAQLPVPAPVSGHDDKHWARIRLTLRNSTDIRRLTDFLDEIHATMQEPENARHVVAVQATPSAVANVIAGPAGAAAPPAGTLGRPPAGPPADGGKQRPASVLTSDLDLVSGAAVDNEMPDARTWRALAICADARSNIESDILAHVAAARPHFQLGGLTYALLHGTAVMVLFVHEPPGSEAAAAPDSAAELEATLQQQPGCDKLRVLLSRRLSHEDMEPVVERPYPMLHVYFRWQDRPGATLNVLESISATLKEALPAIGGKDWSVSYARLQVLTGQVAIARLTIRMHIQPQDIEGWTAERMEEMARNIEFLAASAAAQQAAEAVPDGSAHTLNTPEEPVVRIDRIKKI